MTSEEILKNPERVAAIIDHTLLKPEATHHDVARLCAEAREFHFGAVCINPCWVPAAVEMLSGSHVRVGTVIGFPLGANRSLTKFEEAQRAISEGAQELDIVQNIGALRTGNARLVGDEIAMIVELAHASGAIVKVILETSLLTEEQKIASCRLAAHAGADFVKSSTGFSSGGATVDDVTLMRRTVPESVGVKASGGIRTFAAVEEMVLAGATRIGTSSGIAILREAKTGSTEAVAAGSKNQY